MERSPLHDLRHDELIALILQLQDRLAVLEARDRQQTKPLATQAKRIDDQAKRIAELEKRNPTQRLDEAYSVKAEEKRREDARQDGKPEKKKQKSTRRGRISTAEKLAAATHEENIWPGEHLLSDCRWRYSRVAGRIIDG